MRWRTWWFPWTLGVLTGGGMMAALGEGDTRNIATILLVVQVAMLIWDVIVTHRMIGTVRKAQRQAEEYAIRQQRARWN